MPTLHLIGIDSHDLGEKARKAIIQSACAFCTERFKGLLSDFKGEILPISPLAEALKLMAARLASADITVLASGDPLFYGIGRTLIQRFGKENVVIQPALSSMQLAFAHCKEPWEDAAFLSLHGRSKMDILPALLQRRKVFLLTDHQHQPQAIAAEVMRGLDDLGIKNIDCKIMVAENLGLADERITHGSPEEISKQNFAHLNVMVLRLTDPFDGVYPCTTEAQETREVAARSLSGSEGHGQTLTPFGLTEAEIRHSRGLITKDEVRAAILHQLRLPQTGVLWDIGAGSGSISVEAARLCPGLTVYAIERHAEGQANIIANRKKFRLANLHLIPGLAPEALTDLPAPDRVFIGGSSGQLPAIVETVSSRLKTCGIIMASAVTETTRQMAPRLFHQHGFTVAMATISVSREIYPPQPDRAVTLNPITLITGSK